jgi:hypothetical protein
VCLARKGEIRNGYKLLDIKFKRQFEKTERTWKYNIKTKLQKMVGKNVDCFCLVQNKV